MMANQHRGRAVPKEELRTLLEVSNSELGNILEKLPGFLARLGVEAVGISQTSVVSIKEGKKLFLRKVFYESHKKVKMSVTPEEKRLFLIFAAVQLENNRLEESRLRVLDGCSYFKGTGVKEALDRYRLKGYLGAHRDNDINIWSLGWRFYVEYGDTDITEFWRNRNV